MSERIEDLSEEMNLLVSVLRNIWQANFTRTITVLVALTFIAVGVILGTMWASNERLHKTNAIWRGLSDQMQHNRALIKDLEADRAVQQKRYEALMGALEMTRRSVAQRGK